MNIKKEQVMVNGAVLELDIDMDTGTRSSIVYIGEHGQILDKSEAIKAVEIHITEYDEHNHPIMHHKFIVSDKHG